MNSLFQSIYLQSLGFLNKTYYRFFFNLNTRLNKNLFVIYQHLLLIRDGTYARYLKKTRTINFKDNHFQAERKFLSVSKL